jgi:hypothetical protein
VSRGWPRPIEPPEEAQLPPRYAPCAELPAYRYVPGLFPHPTAHSDGHSFGRPEPEAAPLPPERWRDNLSYLYGVDLFNRRYYWEAHEAWEAFWHACDKARTQGLFIQGLIQISAALLRWHMGTERGVRKLYNDGRAKLNRAARESPADYMGLAVVAWLDDLDRIFSGLLTALETDAGDVEFPQIRLQL